MIDLATITDDHLDDAVPTAEAALQSMLRVNHVIATSSGLMALETSLIASGVTPGDRVACDALYPYAILASANVGAAGVALDLDPVTGAPSSAELRRSAELGARVVILTPYAGWRAGVVEAAQVAQSLGLVVLEDRAQCFGPHDDPWTASMSFQRGKLLSCGQGGAVLTHDADLAAGARRTIELGWWPRSRPGDLTQWSSGWEQREQGRSGRLAPISAALLSARLHRVSALADKASRASRMLIHALETIAPGAESPDCIGSRMLPVVTAVGHDREQIALQLRAAGFRAGLPTHPPTTEWPGLRQHWAVSGKLPGTTSILDRLCLVECDLVDSAAS